MKARVKTLTGLTEKEEMFCYYLSRCGDENAAAKEAGYKNPAQKARSLMSRQEIIKKTLDMLSAKREISYAVAEAQILRLICEDARSPERLQSEDNAYFGLSEMKKGDKGLEMKFVDKLRAYEILYRAGGIKEKASSDTLIEAIRNGAQALSSGGAVFDEV